MLTEAAAQDDEHAFARIVGLAVWYAGALHRGDHYRGVVAFCDEVIPLIPEQEFLEKMTLIKHKYAQSLRMIDEDLKAKSIIEEVLEDVSSSDTKQSLLVNLAFCHQSLDEIDEAKAAAKRVVEIDRHSSFGHHARALLIELDTDSDRKNSKRLKYSVERMMR